MELRGDLRVPWPCLSLAGSPLGVLEVVGGPAQPGAAEEDTEVTIIIMSAAFTLLLLPFFSLLCLCSPYLYSSSVAFTSVSVKYTLTSISCHYWMSFISWQEVTQL